MQSQKLTPQGCRRWSLRSLWGEDLCAPGQLGPDRAPVLPKMLMVNFVVPDTGVLSDIPGLLQKT